MRWNQPEACRQLSGRLLDNEQPAQCTACGAHLFDDAPVTGYAYRFSDEPAYSLGHLYCTPCDRDRIEYSTLGAHEVLFLSRLTREENAFALADVEVLEYSQPTDSGQEPIDFE